jgi:hypothetical protein
MTRVNKERAARAVLGTCIALASTALEAKPTEGGVWNVLAYEVDLKGRDVVLTRQHLEECVKNFGRYPKVPVVIEHADTDWWNDYPAEYAEPHGWITELRLNESFTRADGRVVCALEGRMALDDKTKGEVNADPPKWPFGSVTIFFDQRDEESGEFIGAVLWSFSLTAHPALVDVPRLAASARINPETKTMNKFLMLAAAMGLAALPTEEAAQEAVAERAKETADARKALGLSADAPKADVLAKIAELMAASTKVEALMKQNAELSAKVESAEAAQRADHVSSLISSDPSLEPARAAFEAWAKADYAAFAKAYPRHETKPAPAAPTEEAPKGAHLSSLDEAARAARSRAKAPTTDADPAKAHEQKCISLAHKFMNNGLARSFTEALALAEQELGAAEGKKG